MDLGAIAEDLDFPEIVDALLASSVSQEEADAHDAAINPIAPGPSSASHQGNPELADASAGSMGTVLEPPKRIVASKDHFNPHQFARYGARREFEHRQRASRPPADATKYEARRERALKRKRGPLGRYLPKAPERPIAPPIARPGAQARPRRSSSRSPRGEGAAQTTGRSAKARM